jgi:hypothetical protein
VEPTVHQYVQQGHKVLLLEPSAGTGMFTGALQQLAVKYPGKVEVQAYELCAGQATIADALGHPTTGGWNSLLPPALDRCTYTTDPNTKVVVVGNPPYGRRGATVVRGKSGHRMHISVCGVASTHLNVHTSAAATNFPVCWHKQRKVDLGHSIRHSPISLLSLPSTY